MSRIPPSLVSMILIGETNIYKHPRSKTLYLSIPSGVATDSQFPFKGGERVKIEYDVATKSIKIVPEDNKADKPKKQEKTHE